jgi:hypothetical protein
MTFRALCLGIAAAVVVPIVVYLLALQILTAAGTCALPVDCSFDANEIALQTALPGLLAGLALSILRDRRRTGTAR